MIVDCNCENCKYRIDMVKLYDAHIWQDDCDKYGTEYCRKQNLQYFKDAEKFAQKLIDHAKSMSKADRIRAMNDSSLASFLASIGWDCHFCEEQHRLENEPFLKDEKCDEECMIHCLKWLKQPAEVEE
jgi:hypothetical protein